MARKEWATPPVMVSTAPGATVRQALRLMTLHDVSQLPVMDGAVCVGSVSESSLTARALENPKLLDATVGDVMEPPFPIVDVTTAGRRRGQAAVQDKSGGARAVQRRRAGDRDARGHAAVPDGQIREDEKTRRRDLRCE